MKLATFASASIAERIRRKVNMTKKQEIEEVFTQWENAKDFSGVISISNEDGIYYEKVQGFRIEASSYLTKGTLLSALPPERSFLPQ